MLVKNKKGIWLLVISAAKQIDWNTLPQNVEKVKEYIPEISMMFVYAHPEKLDFQSLDIIERAIHSCGKFAFRSDKYRPEVYEDFRTIDFTLISSAIPSTDFLK